MFITRNHSFIQLCRLDKLTGVWLVMVPCWWGVALSQSLTQSFMQQGKFYFQLFLFFIGALSMRAAGCIVNDLTDRKFDRAVERTRGRPLVAGTATVKQAIFYFGLMCSVGLGVFLFLSPLAKILSLIAFVLLFIYPWMKRITHWPQFVLGLAFNSGVLIAYANNTQTLNRTVWLVYGAGIFWTLAYDTIYAFQDIEDDLKVGVKSTAILFKKYPKLLPMISYAGMLLIFVTLYLQKGGADYVHSDCGFVFWRGNWNFWIGIPLFLSFVCDVLWYWNPNDHQSSLKAFKQNKVFGWVVFFILLGCL